MDNKEEWKERYRNCRWCNKPLDQSSFEWACKRHEKMCCSTECMSAERLARFACCDKAKFVQCVCDAATSCPDHGLRHFGSHE